MPDVYERIAESFIGASKEIEDLFPKPTKPPPRYPFAEYFEEVTGRIGEAEEALAAMHPALGTRDTIEVAPGIRVNQKGQVWQEGTPVAVGKMNLETREFKPAPWVKGAEGLLKGIETALFPWTASGIEQRRLGERRRLQVEEPEAYREFIEVQAKVYEQQYAGKTVSEQLKQEFVRTKAKWQGILPGTKAYEEFRELPFWEQLMYEAPAWIATSMLPAAAGIRATLAPAAQAGKILPTVARTALAPIAAVEAAPIMVLKYGLVWPVKQVAVKGVGPALKKSFELALDQGLDKWLVRQGIRGAQAPKVVQWFMSKNQFWLFEQGKKNLLKKRAGRINVDQRAAMAAEETVAQAEPKLLEAVTGSGVRPAAAPPATVAVAPRVPPAPLRAPPAVVIPKIEVGDFIQLKGEIGKGLKAPRGVVTGEGIMGKNIPAWKIRQANGEITLIAKDEAVAIGKPPVPEEVPPVPEVTPEVAEEIIIGTAGEYAIDLNMPKRYHSLETPIILSGKVSNAQFDAMQNRIIVPEFVEPRVSIEGARHEIEHAYEYSKLFKISEARPTLRTITDIILRQRGNVSDAQIKQAVRVSEVEAPLRQKVIGTALRYRDFIKRRIGELAIPPAVAPPTVPPKFAVEKPFVREVPITPPPVTPPPAKPPVPPAIPPAPPAAPPPPVEPPVFMTAEMWGRMPIISRAKAARSAGLEGKVGAKAWADLTATEKTALGHEPLAISELIARAEARSKAIKPSIPEATAGMEVELGASGRLIEPLASESQRVAILDLGKQKLVVSEANKPKPQLTHLMRGLTGKSKIDKLTEAEADNLIIALDRLEVKYGKPPRIPITTGLITKEFADKIPFIKEIGVLERVRPTRQVFEKMGLRAEIWEPAFEAETKIYEARMAFRKELEPIGKRIGRIGSERDQKLWRAIEHPAEMELLTPEEKKIALWGKAFYDKWADDLKLPLEKRRQNYITHIFEEDIAKQLKTKHPLDPELIKAFDYVTPKTVFNPYLQQRLGQEVGLRESFLSSINAYENRALKVYYYEPLIQKIRVYEKYLPPSSAKYLKGFITRITGRPLGIDREVNQTLGEFANAIEKFPGGKELGKHFTRGNASGLAAYQLTSALYFMWLGFKPTSAIRNLSQHSLALAEVGPIDFAGGMGLRLTREGKDVLKESLVLRSRRQAFIPGIDSSFASRWTDAVREKALWMFRQADRQNVSDAFLSGYAEAKRKGLPRNWAIKRGDEVAADTQYVYTQLGGAAWSQPALGRALSVLTTWPENWVELMTRFIKGRPSYVFREYEAATGRKVEPTNWLLRRKALLLYLAIVGSGYVIKENTRLKAWEYTGLTSLRYLADLASGEFPALQYPGAVADVIVGFLTDDEYRLKGGLYKLKPVNLMGIVRQLDDVISGEKDWLTLFVYLKGQDFHIKKLGETWEREYNNYADYEALEKVSERYAYRETHPEIDAKLFITGRFTTLRSYKAKQITLDLIKKHKLDTELIRGYENMFGPEAKPIKTPAFHPYVGKAQTWENIKKDLDSKLLKALNRLWYEGGSLTPDEIEKLQKIHWDYPLGYTNFNAWIKQGLRQLFENSVVKPGE